MVVRRCGCSDAARLPGQSAWIESAVPRQELAQSWMSWATTIPSATSRTQPAGTARSLCPPGAAADRRARLTLQPRWQAAAEHYPSTCPSDPIEASEWRHLAVPDG